MTKFVFNVLFSDTLSVFGINLLTRISLRGKKSAVSLDSDALDLGVGTRIDFGVRIFISES